MVVEVLVSVGEEDSEPLIRKGRRVYPAWLDGSVCEQRSAHVTTEVVRLDKKKKRKERENRVRFYHYMALTTGKCQPSSKLPMLNPSLPTYRCATIASNHKIRVLSIKLQPNPSHSRNPTHLPQRRY